MKVERLWDIQTCNQSDFVVVDKDQKTAGVTDVAVPRDGNIKRYEMLEKHHGLKEEQEKMWKVKAKVVP